MRAEQPKDLEENIMARQNIKTPGFTPVANPERAKAMAEIRRSSAASSHDTRPNRQRSRRDAKRASIRNGW
jgi:hypothetical protein